MRPGVPGPLRQLPARIVPQRLRSAIRQRVVDVFARGRGDGPQIDYDHPLNDPGLFGPDSVTWKIHADFPGMMAGGLCALMLQTLHPLALAGVWDHSDFRHDLLGRLRRTTGFIVATTYAPQSEAQKFIRYVRQLHRHVSGQAQDGRPYSAEDPRLLNWVHCTETWSFLRGYERYHGVQLPRAVRDRYFDEMRRIAEALGARGVPRTLEEVEGFFQGIQAELEYSERSRAVLQVLDRVQLPIAAAGWSREVFLGAGAALLPPWALRHMRRSRARRLRDLAAARSLRAVAPVLRAALNEGTGARACQRVGRTTAALRFP
jgi:uncharacterized protein (DUF2236 family)